MTDPHDDLAEVLGPQPGQPSLALREAVLHRTERRLMRDRWMLRAGKAGVIAAVFLVGGAVGWMVRPPVADAPGSPEMVVVVVPIPTPGVFVPGSPVVPPVADAPGSPLSASEAELRAEQADDAEAAKLYRTAGNAFLRAEDYPNATRCYRLFLLRAGDAALALEADDSWLLVSLKNAAFKEKTNGPKTDG